MIDAQPLCANAIIAYIIAFPPITAGIFGTIPMLKCMWNALSLCWFIMVAHSNEGLTHLEYIAIEMWVAHTSILCV